MSTRSVLVLVTYDVADNIRREKLSWLLSNCGARVHLSVFECELADNDSLAALVSEARSLVDPQEDQVRFYRLAFDGSAVSPAVIVGARTLEERADFYII